MVKEEEQQEEFEDSKHDKVLKICQILEKDMEKINKINPKDDDAYDKERFHLCVKYFPVF